MHKAGKAVFREEHARVAAKHNGLEHAQASEFGDDTHTHKYTAVDDEAPPTNRSGAPSALTSTTTMVAPSVPDDAGAGSCTSQHT